MTTASKKKIAPIYVPHVASGKPYEFGEYGRSICDHDGHKGSHEASICGFTFNLANKHNGYTPFVIVNIITGLIVDPFTGEYEEEE